jgi:hypothetical protein
MRSARVQPLPPINPTLLHDVIYEPCTGYLRVSTEEVFSGYLKSTFRGGKTRERGMGEHQGGLPLEWVDEGAWALGRRGMGDRGGMRRKGTASGGGVRVGGTRVTRIVGRQLS